MEATDRDSYQDVKQWLLKSMRVIGKTGPHEWGRFYVMSTMGAILNLAEFAEDDEVRRLATMVVDHYLAQVSGFVVNGNYGSSAIRMWSWTFSSVLPQTSVARTLFPQLFPPLDEGLRVDWVVSNYRPPRIVAELFAHEGPSEARLTTGYEKWRHHVYRGHRYLIATHQAIKNGKFDLRTGGTHGVRGVFVQSAKAPRNCVYPFGCSPMTPPAKQRNITERYYGYRNVGFAHHGGVIRAVWARGGRSVGVPIRLFYSFGFRSRLEKEWAFLTDGDVYVAWRPTRGLPVEDPETGQRTAAPEWGGKWLKSTHVPGAYGEVSIVEVGDARSFGDFEAFRADVRARNPAPAWRDGKVSYRCGDKTLIEFGTDYVKLNGQNVSVEDYPRAEMPGVNDYTVTAGDRRVTFDFDAVSVRGALPRAEAGRLFSRDDDSGNGEPEAKTEH